MSAYYATFVGGPKHGQHEELEGVPATFYRVPFVPPLAPAQAVVFGSDLGEAASMMRYANYTLLGPVVADGVMRQLYLYSGAG